MSTIPRKNHSSHQPKRRRVDDPTHVPRTQRVSSPLEVENIVLPIGSFCGKLAFTEADAPKALAQAQAKRVSEGSNRMEKRWYLCPRCHLAHLTSRESWTPEAGHE